MTDHQRLKQRISFLQQMQATEPETSSWFDESLSQLINEESNTVTD
ncbi:hypothetical protein P9222_08960 [Paenibacillus amylolyticus]|nr:hypothetical protein [Paenibacillus amylolyticus]WFR64279.1 hypothetical protein P9222_08960 [Paenibacillus amylolyticus]